MKEDRGACLASTGHEFKHQTTKTEKKILERVYAYDSDMSFEMTEMIIIWEVIMY
jgi:hypothetical protein